MDSHEKNADVDATVVAHQADGTDDARLFAAVQAYVAAVESGRRPNRQEFVARHPEIAADLSACLQGLALVNSAAAQINGRTEDAGHNSEPLTARSLGDFRLLREIGRGGMGVVYEALQLSLGRRVAVKILPMAAALDPRHLERFRNEAHAAARLHHTNIVPVHAVGCERSVHFYAMQLINGQSLAEVIEELRGGNSPSQKCVEPSSSLLNSNDACAPSSVDGRVSAPLKSAANLSMLHSSKRIAYFRAIATLVLQAAEALGYAHQQGIVHRDIKPANLMLDAKGTLWITDFGLAQMYANPGLTQTGDLLGTLRYMSPEQASGRAVVLDQRTDIYSLGITLYELLTLERALSGTTREQLLQQINSIDPRSPRSIDSKIPVELENIIGKATSKDAEERYPTAEALAQDLQRFLDDEPVLAHPPSWWNKAVKWTRRHRTVAMSAVIVLLLAFIGAVVSGILIAREQSRTAAAYVREQHRAQEANEQRELAQKNFAQARQAVDFFTSTAINDLPPDPKLLQVRRRLLERSFDYYQSFLEQHTDDASLDAELTTAKAQVVAVLAELTAVDEFVRADFEVRFLASRPMQEDLGLTPQQAADAKDLAARIGAERPHVAPSIGMTSLQIRASILQDSAERTSEIAKILTPLQSRRLHEISRQTRGVFAFSDPDIAAALSLTPIQKSFLRSACADFQKRHRDPDGSLGEKADMQAAVATLLTRLDSRQIEAWQALTGRTYDGTVPLFAPEDRGADHHGPSDRRPF